ncbi:MAG TPA: class I SAM-dependent methyltransferase [Candidatus Saccharimonadales bacterium]|nr:class I SAM-dependent methyltransferase [Candidatus Saccharimonadales bacterium]HLD85911.1 class I SAM-dependent methyltransferase [Patescibacteria group bacterium]
MTDFLTQFFSLIKPNQNVLDLGAGSGKHALAMAERGCRVWAVDKKEGNVKHDLITWQISSIQDWIKKSSALKFDVVLMNNLIQFLSKEFVKEELIPVLVKRTLDSSVIGIRTFFKPPAPPFDSVLSYWTISELQDLFPDWQCMYKNEVSETKPDMLGESRLFHLTSIILANNKV